MICGVISTAKPFGYVDPAKGREILGYDVDVCRALARNLGVKASIRQLAGDTRIPELLQGRIDILTAALSWTSERAEQIDFSNKYFEARLVVAVRADAGIDTLAGLDGRRVSVPKGSTSEITLRNKHPLAQVVSYPDAPSAFLTFQQGRTEAFSISELLMRQLISNAGDFGSQIRVLPEALQTDPWGVGVRKGETALVTALNEALTQLETSGEGQAIFQRWFSPETGFILTRSFKFEPITTK